MWALAPAPEAEPPAPEFVQRTDWEHIMWEQFEFLMDHKTDDRFGPLFLLLLSPFND